MDKSTKDVSLSIELDEETLSIVKKIENKEKNNSKLTKELKNTVFSLREHHEVTFLVISKYLSEEHGIEIGIPALSRLVARMRDEQNPKKQEQKARAKKEEKELKPTKPFQGGKPMKRTTESGENHVNTPPKKNDEISGVNQEKNDLPQKVEPTEDVKANSREVDLERLRWLKEKSRSKEKLNTDELREFWDLKTKKVEE